MIEQKGRRPKPTPLRDVAKATVALHFVSSHILVVAFQVPPAFAQSVSVFAAVTSPAKAGTVKASPMARASMETRPFLALLPYAGTKPRV